MEFFKNMKSTFLLTVVVFIVFFGVALLFLSSGEEPAPEKTIEEIDFSGDVFLGDGDAPVTIIEFSDFECPYCGQFHKSTFQQLKKNYIETGKVKFIYKHFPLPFHSNAQKTAEALECATEQGKRWEMLDKTFYGSSLSIESLKLYAVELELNSGEFNDCLDSGKYFERVQKDYQEGKEVGVKGTPSFFINGEFVEGAPNYDEFEVLINN